MTFRTLAVRSISYYWRTHVAVVASVAVSVGVLAGALLVGESVRASLRDLFLARLGKTEVVVSGRGFFRETLGGGAPLIVLDGTVTHDVSGRRAARVKVYGVDDRFYRFQGWSGEGGSGRNAVLSEAVAREIDARPGDAVLIRVEKPSPISAETLHGRRDDLGRTLRLAVREGLAEFSLAPAQGDVRAVLVPLARLQRDLDVSGKVNTIVTAGEGAAEIETRVRTTFALEDVGVRLRALPECGVLSVEADAVLVEDQTAAAAREAAHSLGAEIEPVLTYLANSIRSGKREVPYSLVSAVDGVVEEGLALNAWAAADLDAKAGDRVELEYYVWEDAGRLSTRRASFQLERVVPLEGDYRDPHLAPRVPGISDSPDLSDWDPPFPVDMKRIRPKDEKYWDDYRTTPKAFIPLSKGQALWQSRYGKVTSIRVRPPAGESLASFERTFGDELRRQLDPLEVGFSIVPVRSEGLRASRGATDFGAYFFYFSFFLVTAALLLTGLSFKLSVEERAMELGTLAVLGFTPRDLRRLLLREGLLLGMAGCLLGVLVAWAYAALIMMGLRTFWIDAVGTRLLTLHVSPWPLLSGAAGGLLCAIAVIALTLRSLASLTPRELIAGIVATSRPPAPRRVTRWLGAAPVVAGLALLILSTLGLLSQVPAFFGAGALFLAGLLSTEWGFLARSPMTLLEGHGSAALARLGFRNTRVKVGRSLLSIALVALAVFVLVAVEAFRREPPSAEELGPRSGTGGFALLAESLLPVYRDPNSVEGREALNLDLPDIQFYPFRVRPGDDTSCLNLYAPGRPRILAPTPDLVRSGRFRFRAAVTSSPEERANPWLVLNRKLPGAAVPAIVDANSLEYVLHRKLGDTIEMDGAELTLVAALDDSILQGELLVSEESFMRLFPESSGYRFFLIDVPSAKVSDATAALEKKLADFGFDVTAAYERLAEFHRVENTYLSTFQALGALGLLLGTLGLGGVLLRNVLERRRELALLRAVGYDARHVTLLIVSENAFLLGSGLLAGTVSALVSIAPALSSRAGGLPMGSMTVLLALIVCFGLVASAGAVAAAVRMPLLESLRRE